MTLPRLDLLLCGGGVIGLSIAFQCAKMGWKVAVVDQGDIGRAASWAGAGILPAGATIAPLDPLEQLRALSHSMHADWSRQLLDISGIDNEYRACGGLYVARTPAEKATLAANQFWWDEHGIPYERWDELTTREMVPDLARASDRNSDAKGPDDYWWLPSDCRVRNPRHVEALAKSVQSLGGILIAFDGVRQIQMESNRIDYLELQSGHRLRAENYCISSGAWSQRLLEPLGIQTGILPVRGQMVLYKLEVPRFSCIVNDGHRYLVPRDDGHLLAGSCEEEVGFNVATTECMIEEIKDWAVSLLPCLAQTPIVQTWAGLRPGSFDGYPYLGGLPGVANAYVASGHFRHGLHWSTGTALLMQQLMFGEAPAIDLAPFRVLRGFNSKLN